LFGKSGVSICLVYAEVQGFANQKGSQSKGTDSIDCEFQVEDKMIVLIWKLPELKSVVVGLLKQC
jgi:hypothetical protein